MINNDTIIAIGTAPQGAIGVIRISGPKAIEITDQFFFGRNLNKVSSHTVHYGKIKNESDQILDECLATVFIGPRSYTRENVVELSCHGSSYILSEIVQLFIRHGVRQANPGEFTMRAFLNGQLDLSQAEAVADLIASENESTHRLAMNQMRGGVSEKIKNLRDQLVHFASMIELELDFGEEDVEFANRDELIELVKRISLVVGNLLDSFKLGNVLKNGVQTVIAGRPNAGKSTLLNALLEEDRAIVSDIPGTTRDTIEESINIDGVLFHFVDTAGIRNAEDKIEVIGIEKTKDKIARSQISLYLIDASQTTPEQAWEELKDANLNVDSCFLILNKMDLNPYVKPEEYIHSDWIPSERIISASALNKMNVPFIKERLHDFVLDGHIKMDQVLISNQRHYNSLYSTKEALNRVQQGIDNGVSSDFVAMDIRQATQHLGEITGEISTDDLLEKIFSSFCIGK